MSVLGPDGPRGTFDPTVGQWLDLYEEKPQEAGAILLAAIRGATRWKRRQSADRDDLSAETAARVLDSNAVALRRAPAATPLPAWVHGCVANVWREMCRTRHKEKEKRSPEESPDPAPCPYEDAAERDELKCERKKVLKAAHFMPRPYGHVLVWRLIEGLSWQEIRDGLNAHRPTGAPLIGDRQVQTFLTKAMKMLKDWIGGTDPHAAHHLKFLSKKNPWIDSLLPPLPSQI